MNQRSMYFVVAVAIFVMLLLLVAAYFHWKARRVTKGNWKDLLGRLRGLDREGIAKVALDYADEFGRRRIDETGPQLQPTEISDLVGGVEGLEIMESNSAVLIDLASYVQQWHPEALVLAEDLRLSAREIGWHVDRLRGALRAGNLEQAFMDYAQPAVARYYLMTRKVLALYERSELPLFADLERAI